MGLHTQTQLCEGGLLMQAPKAQAKSQRGQFPLRWAHNCSGCNAKRVTRASQWAGPQGNQAKRNAVSGKLWARFGARVLRKHACLRKPRAKRCFASRRAARPCTTKRGARAGACGAQRRAPQCGRRVVQSMRGARCARQRRRNAGAVPPKGALSSRPAGGRSRHAGTAGARPRCCPNRTLRRAAAAAPQLRDSRSITGFTATA
jgi:hypothetical protein